MHACFFHTVHWVNDYNKQVSPSSPIWQCQVNHPYTACWLKHSSNSYLLRVQCTLFSDTCHCMRNWVSWGINSFQKQLWRTSYTSGLGLFPNFATESETKKGLNGAISISRYSHLLDVSNNIYTIGQSANWLQWKQIKTVNAFHCSLGPIYTRVSLHFCAGDQWGFQPGIFSFSYERK